MTEKEADQLRETRMYVLNRAAWCCENCGRELTSAGFQLAHRIPQRKPFLKRYGKKIIHHPANLRAVCCEGCNATVSLGYNTENHKIVLEEIERQDLRESWYEE